jgi:branched-chain amino acid transport system substrate-binding protein
MEDLTGMRLGQYQVIAPLGEGGMAAVFKAFQPGMDRYVALKILPRQLASDPEFVGRFTQEAKVIANLQHPHILPVFDFGEADGYTYIVMPFVSSGTLADLLKGQPLPLKDIRTIVTQVGDALDYAHSNGLVHRDVKPSNVLVDARRNCLLTDFGIAKIVEGTARFTATGGLVGTPAYMSPEQGTGEKVDRRSDIYSLGVILYEMATGRAPFNAETPIAIVIKHINDPLPPPRLINPALPEALERVILKALAKRPDDRYATAADLVRAVQQALPETSLAAAAVETAAIAPAETVVRPTAPAPSAPAPRAEQRRRLPAWLWVLGGLLVVGGAIGILAVAGGGAGRASATPTASKPAQATPAPRATPTAQAQIAPKRGVIKVVTHSPLTGALSTLGVDVKSGAELAAEQLSGPLRKMGFELELAAYDDQADRDVGVENAKQIVADPDILCGVGHLNSGVMLLASEEYHRAGLAFVSPANTLAQLTERGYLEVNRIVGRDDRQGALGAEFAQSLGVKTVKVFHDDTPYGIGVSEAFVARAEELGLAVVGFETTIERSDFRSEIAGTLKTNPDMVYFAGTYDQVGVFFRQARERGYRGLFMGPDGLDSSALAEIAGDALTTGGAYYTTVAGPASAYPGAARFVQDFQARFGRYPQPFAAQAYDAMGICLAGIERAAAENGGNRPTREQVARAVRATQNYAGLTGRLSFDEKGDLEIARYLVIKVTSPDPARWSENPIERMVELQPAGLPAAEPRKIAVVLDTGGENDKSFNEYTLKGARDAANRLGYELTYVVSQSSSDYEKSIELFAGEGAHLIISVGFLMGDATAVAAQRHPDIRFAVVDFAYEERRYANELKNVTSLMFAEDEAAYPAGVLAACMSRSGVMATVSGTEIPPVVKFVTGFQNGARWFNPDIKLLNIYIPDFNDATTGKQAGQDFINQGADVIFGVGGNTGNGGLLAAKEAGLMAIGVDVDQYFTYPEVRSALLTSAVKNVDIAAAQAVEAFSRGELTPGVRWATIANGGVGIAPYHDWESRIPQVCKDKVSAAIEGLKGGALSTGYRP